MYLTGLGQYTWEVDNAPEMEKRRIIKSLKNPQSLSGLGADTTFQDRIQQLWTGLDNLKSFIASKPKVELPADVKEKLSGVAKTAGNYLPYVLGAVAVGAGIWFFTRKK